MWRLCAACLRSVDVWQIWGTSAAEAEAACLCGWSAKRLRLSVGWGEISGNHQGRVNCVSQVNVEHILGNHLYWAGWVGGGFKKGTVVPTSSSVPRQSCPKPCLSNLHPQVSQFSSYPYVPGTFWAAVPSLKLWVSFTLMRLCADPSSAACHGSPALSFSDTVPAAFHNQMLWGLLFLAPSQTS